MLRKRDMKQELNQIHRKLLKARAQIIELQDNVENRDKVIKHLEKENSKKKAFIAEVGKLATCNTYNNEHILLGKIKELVHDYQEEN